MPGDGDDLIVICGTTFWSGTRLLDQHIATELTAYAPVLYVDPPVSVLTRLRNRDAAASAHAPGVERLGPRLNLLSPRVLPLKERPGGKQVALALTRRAMRSAVRELGSPNVRAVIVPSLNPLFGAVGERHRVFYAKDDYVAGASLMGINPRRLRARAVQQPRDADIVVAVSTVLAQQLAAPGIEPLVIPNGCDVEAFGAAGAPPTTSAPVVAYVGHLSDRVDVGLLEAVAATGVRLRIIGPRQETMSSGHFDPLQRHENVEWTGAVPYDGLAAALADVTVCVLPYADTDFNRASFPLKILEYLAAGRRVVSTPLAAVQWLDTPLIETATTAEDFAAAVGRALETPLGPDEVARRRAFAAEHTWARRVRGLADVLGLGAASPARPAGTGSP